MIGMGIQKDSAHSFEPANAQLIAQAKAGLRGRLCALRMQLPPAKRSERSQNIVTRILQMPLFERAQLIASYAAINNEVDLTALHQKAWSLGKRIALPVVEEQGGPLDFKIFEENASLIRNRFGIFQPAEDAQQVLASEIDCIFVPCVAVDLMGYRLGYGHGYFDRFFAQHIVTSVAVAYDFQVLGELPHAPHDRPMDWIVSDTESLKANAG
jgi:5-formyltetrahydrofolate cyclo-ligase